MVEAVKDNLRLRVKGGFMGGLGIASTTVGALVENALIQNGTAQPLLKSAIEGNILENPQVFALAAIVSGLMCIGAGRDLHHLGSVLKTTRRRHG